MLVLVIQDPAPTLVKDAQKFPKGTRFLTSWESLNQANYLSWDVFNKVNIKSIGMVSNSLQRDREGQGRPGSMVGV